MRHLRFITALRANSARCQERFAIEKQFHSGAIIGGYRSE
jgi:hypothetical protein